MSKSLAHGDNSQPDATESLDQRAAPRVHHQEQLCAHFDHDGHGTETATVWLYNLSRTGACLRSIRRLPSQLRITFRDSRPLELDVVRETRLPSGIWEYGTRFVSPVLQESECSETLSLTESVFLEILTGPVDSAKSTSKDRRKRQSVHLTREQLNALRAVANRSARSHIAIHRLRQRRIWIAMGWTLPLSLGILATVIQRGHLARFGLSTEMTPVIVALGAITAIRWLLTLASMSRCRNLAQFSLDS